MIQARSSPPYLSERFYKTPWSMIAFGGVQVAVVLLFLAYANRFSTCSAFQSPKNGHYGAFRQQQKAHNAPLLRQLASTRRRDDITIPPNAKLEKGESWIRLPIVVDYFHSTVAALEELLQAMFFGDGGGQNSVSAVNAGIGVDPVVSVSQQGVDWSWSCYIPTFKSQISVQLLSDINMLVISMNATDSQDFGWICSQFYSQKTTLNQIGVDCETSLRKVVAIFFNELPPDQGDVALPSAWSQRQREHFERCLNRRSLMETLDEHGYIILDGAMEHELPPLPELSMSLEASLLLELTDQGNQVRTDRVLFVSSQMASDCGLGPAEEFLRGIAHYLNQDIASRHPTFSDELLTLPDRLQFAEYGHKDFYKAHRDNSLTGILSQDGTEVRSNFRAYTCILYLNDNEWDTAHDGGALRIYPGTEHSTTLESLSDRPFVDVCPGPYGRLLIFDSRTVHSVEPVLRTAGCRRALTLWINRPLDNHLVPGETYF